MSLCRSSRPPPPPIVRFRPKSASRSSLLSYQQQSVTNAEAVLIKSDYILKQVEYIYNLSADAVT